MDDKQTNFANNLKFLRSSRGMTQKAMANLLSVQPNSYQKYEYGERTPEISSLIDLCRYFEVSIEQIFTADLSIQSPLEKFIENLIYKTENNIIYWARLDKEMSEYFDTHVVIRHDRREFYQGENLDPNDVQSLDYDLHVYYIIHNNGVVYFTNECLIDIFDIVIGECNHVFIKNGVDNNVSILTDDVSKFTKAILQKLSKLIYNQVYVIPIQKRNEDFLLSFIGEKNTASAFDNFTENFKGPLLKLPTSIGCFIISDNEIEEYDIQETADASLEYFNKHIKDCGSVVRASTCKNTNLLLYFANGKIMRLGGCTSGYNGNSTRKTYEVLTACGFIVPIHYISTHEEFDISLNQNIKLISPRPWE